MDRPVIPLGNSERLREALAGRSGVRYTEIVMFRHLHRAKVPLRLRVRVRVRLRELGRFYLALYPVVW